MNLDVLLIVVIISDFSIDIYVYLRMSPSPAGWERIWFLKFLQLNILLEFINGNSIAKQRWAVSGQHGYYCAVRTSGVVIWDGYVGAGIRFQTVIFGGYLVVNEKLSQFSLPSRKFAFTPLQTNIVIFNK